VRRVSERHRILVVGEGGREHALAWRLSRDPEVESVHVAPGNDGIALEFSCHSIPIDDVAGLIGLCRLERITLAVIGPDAALAAGLADALRAAGIATFGPSRDAARLEWSKWFAKEVLAEANVSTARAERFTSLATARDALPRFGPPWVIKADGLRAGKGVTVTSDRGGAEQALASAFADTPDAVVVLECFLAGDEASVIAITDGRRFVLLPAARDYKRALDSDRGPNTGGMGAYAPNPRIDETQEAEIGRRIVAPVLERMAARGTPFQGALYAGLMLTAQGPSVVEFNARFGDPEAEVILPLVDGSFTRLLASAASGALDESAITRRPGAAVDVVVAATATRSTAIGGEIAGLGTLTRESDVRLFYAGIARTGETWRARGGRIAHVVGFGESVGAARTRAYRAVGMLGGRGWRTRTDIAAEAGSDEPAQAAHGMGRG
jgi:phosphoribosylamine--glycine ligase